MSHLKYFAYGSNMLTERLRRRVPSTVPIGRARLAGWELRFHKRGADGSAKCDIRLGEGLVHGVLFSIDPAERHLLDRAEGLGHGYEIEHLAVNTSDGAVEAFCYVAQSDYIDASLRPFGWYRDFVVHGAREHKLPGDYIQRVMQVPALVDEQPGRIAKNREILLAADGAPPSRAATAASQAVSAD